VLPRARLDADDHRPHRTPSLRSTCHNKTVRQTLPERLLIVSRTTASHVFASSDAVLPRAEVKEKFGHHALPAFAAVAARDGSQKIDPRVRRDVSGIEFRFSTTIADLLAGST
jgi:hypothetical protein